MATAHTSNQQLPYPDHFEKMNLGWAEIRDALLAVEPKLNMLFTTQADLATRVPTPTEGMVAYITADNVLQVYDGTAWQRIWPTSPAIYSGSTTPSSSLGTVGDIYIQS